MLLGGAQRVANGQRISWDFKERTCRDRRPVPTAGREQSHAVFGSTSQAGRFGQGTGNMGQPVRDGGMVTQSIHSLEFKHYGQRWSSGERMYGGAQHEEGSPPV